MAAELKATFPEATVTLQPSSGGRFEITRNGMPIFQKSKLGRHPGPGEVVRLLSAPPAADR